MSDPTPIPLTPVLVHPSHPLFGEIADWSFADPFVVRLLHNDIPQRMQFGECRFWAYRDPDGQFVGFGTLDVCKDYGAFTQDRPHPYIPLLAVNPGIKSRGYGTTILRHLVDEAALLALRPELCHDVLFLDVYTTSAPAIKLYNKFAFATLTPTPILDPQEGDKTYIVMAKRVSKSPGPSENQST